MWVTPISRNAESSVAAGVAESPGDVTRGSIAGGTGAGTVSLQGAAFAARHRESPVIVPSPPHVRRRPALVPLLAAAAAACGGSQEAIEGRIARIEAAILPAFTIQGEAPATATLAARMAELGVPGVSVAVISGGEIEWARGYGLADVAAGRPVTSETLFQAASISKPVAGVAALRLVQDGALDLDADVNDALRSWEVPENEFTAAAKVTLRGILTHTAGTTVWGFPGYARNGDAIPTAVDVLEGRGNTDAVRVYKAPGESWQYSGGGYTVMQLLLTDVMGKPFPQLMAETVLSPLGMTRSTYEQPLPPSRHDEAATGYRAGGEAVEGDWHVYPEMAAAGLWTTPSDLARFLIAVQDARAGRSETVLSKATADRMLEPGMNGWGLGPSIAGGTRFGHGGANEGFRATMTAFIDGREGAVIMTNSDTGGRLAAEVLGTIGAEYGWPGVGPEEKQVAVVAPEALDRLAGAYLVSGAVRLTVENRDGTLWAVPRSGDAREMIPQADTAFFFRDDGTPVTFHLDGGSVDAVEIGPVRAARAR